MSYFVIRHIPTGFYLPAVKAGFTWTEPTDDESPRLFQSRNQAKLALGQWLRGQQYIKDKGRETAHLDVHPTPHRTREDMEVIEVAIVPREI